MLGRGHRALAAIAPLVLVAACAGDGGGVERHELVDAEVHRAGSRLTVAQAECYVDAVLDELGAEVLAVDASPSPEQQRRMAALRIDCVGLEQLGVAPPPTAPASPAEPHTLGDDPGLDELWAACEAGAGSACDELFEVAPLGSGYEAFGATCGGRGAEPSCAEAYPDPG